jgi:Ca-activated chloride channel family protein
LNFSNETIFLHMFYLLPLAVLIMMFGHRRRRQRIASFVAGTVLAASLTSNQSVARRRFRNVLMIVALFFILLAVAGPYWGTELVPRPVHSRDLLIVLDTSRSMLAKDVAPSRLQHAKWFIRNFVERTPGDRVGLIAFAGTAFLECPLTEDRNGFLLFLDDITTDSIPVGGTNIEAALQTTLEAFKAAEGAHRAVVFITDGDELQGDSTAALDEFRERNIPLFVVGIGNSDLGAYIQIEDNKFITDENGERVRTKLNQDGLRRLSTATGGIYVHSTVVHDGLDPVFARVRSLIPAEHEDATMARPIQRYQFPLLIGLLLLLVRMMIGERRKTPLTDSSRVVTGSARAAASILLLFALQTGYAQESNEDTDQSQPMFQIHRPGPSQPGPAQSSPPQPTLEDQHRALADRAIEHLEARLDEAKDEREKAYLNYNLGVNYQQTGRNDEAKKHYNTSLDLCDEGELQALAYQNLGVLRHQLADEAMMRDPNEALDTLLEAQDYYREAMRALPDAEGISQNQELAVLQKRLIEEIKKMQEALKDQQQDAKEKAEDALEKQQEANESQQSGAPEEQQQQKQQEAQQKTQEAQEAVQKLADAAREKGQEQAADMLDDVAKQLEKAQDEQQQAADQEAGEEQQQQAGKEAEETLEDVVKRMGGELEKKEGEEGDEDGEATAGEENPDEDSENEGDENSKDAAADAAEQPGEATDGGEPLDEPQIDTTEANHILEQMMKNERDLKQQLKEMQRRNNKHGPVKRDW